MSEFDLAVRIFRKEFKNFKFRVRRISTKASYGTCQKRGDVFFISIHKDLNDELAIHILVHELAHMITWDKCIESEEIHDDRWGKAYSKVYRLYVDKYVKGS